MKHLPPHTKLQFAVWIKPDSVRLGRSNKTVYIFNKGWNVKYKQCEECGHSGDDEYPCGTCTDANYFYTLPKPIDDITVEELETESTRLEVEGRRSNAASSYLSDVLDKKKLMQLIKKGAFSASEWVVKRNGFHANIWDFPELKDSFLNQNDHFFSTFQYEELRIIIYVDDSEILIDADDMDKVYNLLNLTVDIEHLKSVIAEFDEEIRDKIEQQDEIKRILEKYRSA